MKYFTKSYYLSDILSKADCVEVIKYAKRKRKKIYDKIQQRDYIKFYIREACRECYLDPASYARNSELKESENEDNPLFKKLFEITDSYFDENKKFYTFDNELFEHRYRESVNKRISIYSQLPQYILNKIDDIRIFAFGYASAEVKQLLRPHCEELRAKVNEITKQAHAETDEAESLLNVKLGLNGCKNAVIISIEERNGDLVITQENGLQFIIKNGIITEGKDMPVYTHILGKPDSPVSKIVATELHHSDNYFNLCFLVENTDKYNKSELCYLIIQCKDIQINRVSI